MVLGIPRDDHQNKSIREIKLSVLEMRNTNSEKLKSIIFTLVVLRVF